MATMASSLFNGQRAVVILFISRVLLSTPLSLSSLKASLFLSSPSSPSSSRSEASNSLGQFKTRPGASSGILLGTVTLPGLVISRLIQLSRALSLHEVEVEELEYLRLQYWATSACCFSVLVLLGFVLWHLPNNTHSACSCRKWGVKFISSCIFFYAAVCFVSLATTSQSGQPPTKLSMIHIVTCSSHGLAHSIEVIVGTLSWISSCEVSSARASYFSIMCFHWVINFVFSEPLKRLSLCIYWVALVYVSVIRFYNISKNSKLRGFFFENTTICWLADSMFLPALIFQPRFLDLAFGAALAVFLVLEIVRIWKIWPLGHLLHHFMNAFMDHRDSELLIVSHFSLLLGCALLIWMSSGFNDRPLAPFAGIRALELEIQWHQWFAVSMVSSGGAKLAKTIEGTAAGITSVLAACSVLPLLATTGYFYTQHWFSLLIAVTGSGLLEAYTAQLDNAFIPLSSTVFSVCKCGVTNLSK